MAKKQRNSFTFYSSFEDAIATIEESDVQTKMEMYRAICRYALYHEEPRLKGIAKLAWQLIKPTLDKQWAQYINGCKGGAPVGNQNARKNGTS